MSNGNRPLTEAERDRIPHDAEAFLAFIRERGRPGSEDSLTVVSPRWRMARDLTLTLRQFGRAEAYLTERRIISTRNLLPRNPKEAAKPHYRWILLNVTSSERTGS